MSKTQFRLKPPGHKTWTKEQCASYLKFLGLSLTNSLEIDSELRCCAISLSKASWIMQQLTPFSFFVSFAFFPYSTYPSLSLTSLSIYSLHMQLSVYACWNETSQVVHLHFSPHVLLYFSCTKIYFYYRYQKNKTTRNKISSKFHILNFLLLHYSSFWIFYFHYQSTFFSLKYKKKYR